MYKLNFSSKTSQFHLTTNQHLQPPTLIILYNTPTVTLHNLIYAREFELLTFSPVGDSMSSPFFSLAYSGPGGTPRDFSFSTRTLQNKIGTVALNSYQ